MIMTSSAGSADYIMVNETNLEENRTMESHADTGLKMIIRNASTVYYLILIIFGVVGNGLVIFTYYTRAKLRVVSCNFFLVQMSQVNLIVVCLVDPMIMYSMYTERRTVGILCKIYIVIMEVCAGVTAFYIIAIAFNRYFLIVHPRLFRRLCMPKRIKIIIFVLWLFIFFIAGLVITKIDVKKDRVTNRCMLENDSALGRFYNNVILYSFFIPLTICVPFAHALTLSAIRESRRRVKCQMSIPNTSLRNKQEVQGAKSHSHKSVRPPGCPTLNVVKLDNNRSMLMETEITSSCTLKPPFHKFRFDFRVDLPESSSLDKTPDNRVTFNTSGLPSIPFTYKLPKQPVRKGIKKREFPLIRMMSLLYVVLCISWIPWWTKNIVDDERQNSITTIMYALAWLNPIYYSFSPFIYALSNRNFRVVYGDVFRRVVCRA